MGSLYSEKEWLAFSAKKREKEWIAFSVKKSGLLLARRTKVDCLECEEGWIAFSPTKSELPLV